MLFFIAGVLVCIVTPGLKHPFTQLFLTPYVCVHVRVDTNVNLGMLILSCFLLPMASVFPLTKAGRY